MGSLTSRPKMPPQPMPYVMTAPPSSPPQPAPAPQTDLTDSAPEAEQKSAPAKGGLLERRRGILSTVLTGFRGVLDQSPATARKTLLGE